MDKHNPFVDESVLFTCNLYLPILGRHLDFTYGYDYAALFLDMVPYDVEDALDVVLDCIDFHEALQILFCIGKMLCVDPDEELTEIYSDIRDAVIDNYECKQPTDKFDVAVRLPSGKIAEAFSDEDCVLCCIDSEEQDPMSLLTVINSIDDIEIAQLLFFMCARLDGVIEDDLFTRKLGMLSEQYLQKIESM